jgi:1-acyl-sn-glycerol-3-phosphate acyltransferase
MPVQYDKGAHSPFRTKVYLGFGRFFFQPLYVLFNRLEVTGRENIPDGPLVLVANHLSNLDPPLITVAIAKPIAYLAKKELYTMPGFKEFCMFFGAISIDRDKPEKSTFKLVKELFAKGWHLGMFIEGTRNKTPGILGHPHTGPAYFAKANKATIVPIGIIGTNKSFGKVYAHIGKPIKPSDDLNATTWETMQALSDLTGFALPPRHETINEV